MPAQFDWKAEDEGNWGDFEPGKMPSTSGWRHSRRLRLLMLAAIATVLAAVIGARQIDRFLDGNADDIEQQLLAAHQLLVDAATSGDGDLVRELIYDRLQEWTDAQVHLVDEGLFLDRYPLELYLVGDAEAAATTVELDPALRQALIEMRVPYQVGNDGSGEDIVRLRHVFSYRLEDDLWLLNPPPAAFWGTRSTTSGRYLTLGYPERDAELGRRLAADLEGLIGQTCFEVEKINCPEGLHLEVNLVTDPAVLAELADPAWQLTGGRSVRLPTPTLVGLPDDEAAYRALYRAYAKLVVARLITE